MFIKKITIQNFRLFNNEKIFEIDCLNIPDGSEGSGITLFVGENGCGKTTLLDAFSLPLLAFKADSFSLNDFYDPQEKTKIQVFSEKDFEFKGTMPSQKDPYKGKGFIFEAGIRSRENKNYLSSLVVHDQRYIRADGESKPEDGKPDLRVSVNNPWSGTRFNENDILFLDKNRTSQTRSGTYNPTRFDRLMEDFDYQYIKQEGCPIDCNEKVKNASNVIENQFLKKAVEKFKEVSGKELSLSHINNWTPHNNAFFSVIKENKQQILLSSIGSGYEAIFSLIYSFYLSQQSGKQLIAFIDEPELHLHPQIQEDFVAILLEFSKSAQIILTTHSPLFVKQALFNDKVQVNVLKNQDDEVYITKIDERLLPYLSANEINFLAFGLPTEEYHNELYEELKVRDDKTRSLPLNLKDFDSNFFQKTKLESPSYPYNGIQNQVSIHTFLRTQIHHRGSAGIANIEDIKYSIEKMRTFLI